MAWKTCVGFSIVLASVLLALSGSSDTPVHVFHNEVFKGDQGGFTNCGPKESNFILDWTPRVFQPGVTLSIDFSLNIIKSFDHGMVCVTVWLKDVSDPIYYDCRDQKCVDAQKVIKKFMPGFQCPIPEGYGAKFTKFPYLLQPTMPLPSGSFRIAANVTNQDKVLLLCATGEIEIKDE